MAVGRLRIRPDDHGFVLDCTEFCVLRHSKRLQHGHPLVWSPDYEPSRFVDRTNDVNYPRVGHSHFVTGKDLDVVFRIARLHQLLDINHLDAFCGIRCLSPDVSPSDYRNIAGIIAEPL